MSLSDPPRRRRLDATPRLDRRTWCSPVCRTCRRMPGTRRTRGCPRSGRRRKWRWFQSRPRRRGVGCRRRPHHRPRRARPRYLAGLPRPSYAATMQSVWFSEDEGKSWNRLLTPTGGFYNEARVWAVHTHVDRPGDLLAGTDQGLYRFSEASGRFEYIPSPMDSLHILQIAQDPHDPNFIVCGTRPGEIFISEDNGENWTRATLNASTECWFINTSRVTSIHFDPKDRDTIWITVEIDGVIRSTDRGKT